MKGHSVRLRLIGNVQRVFDQAVELVTHRLGKAKVHAQSGANVSLRSVPSVNDCLGQRQIDNAVEMSALNKQTWDHGRNAIIDNDKVYVAYAKRLSASNYNLISHQKSPIGTVHRLSIVNAKAVGVES